MVRTGRGYGPNVVKTYMDDDVALASGLVQFPATAGYDHFSRFASYYRDVYGESPSVTKESAGFRLQNGQ